ncbi:hypothetical protein D3C73_954970 [compost metagenome]
MKKIILTMLLFLICISTATPAAHALSCAAPVQPQEELRHAEIVYSGKLITKSNNKLHFQVSQVWKGSVGSTITLKPNMWIDFNLGAEYVVFASTQEGKLSPRLCGNTGLATSAKISALGTPIPMVQQPMNIPWASLAVGMFLLILVTGIVIVIKRRKGN